MINFVNDIRDKRTIRNLKRILMKIDISQWADIYCKLNSSIIHRPFFLEIPKWWYKPYKKYGDRRHKITWAIMCVITDKIGEKETLRHHNVINGPMSDGEFEYWYNNVRRGGDSIHNKYYHRKNIMYNLEWWKDDVFNKICDTFNLEKERK